MGKEVLEDWYDIGCRLLPKRNFQVIVVGPEGPALYWTDSRTQKPYELLRRISAGALQTLLEKGFIEKTEIGRGLNKIPVLRLSTEGVTRFKTQDREGNIYSPVKTGEGWRGRGNLDFLQEKVPKVGPRMRRQ